MSDFMWGFVCGLYGAGGIMSFIALYHVCEKQGLFKRRQRSGGER